MKKYFAILMVVSSLITVSYAVEPNGIEQIRKENTELRQKHDQLQQDNIKLGKQIQQLTEENKNLKLKLGESASQQDVNSIQKRPDTTLVLKEKILALQQKRIRLADLKAELKAVKPTIMVPQADTIITTKTTTSDGRGNRQYSGSHQDYKKNDPIEKPNPQYTQQKQKILVMENSIAQLEKEILRMNELRIKKGQEPIPVD
jgi:hypothetical protein